jgi:hypothetical protein
MVGREEQGFPATRDSAGKDPPQLHKRRYELSFLKLKKTSRLHGWAGRTRVPRHILAQRVSGHESLSDV